jgi:uncharacterized caspase-like protein
MVWRPGQRNSDPSIIKRAPSNPEGTQMIRLIVCFSVCFAVICQSQAFAAKRLALLIGNKSYEAHPLNTPKNNADDLSKALEEAKFDVTVLNDISQDETKEALQNFNTKPTAGDTVLFYYSGLGFQVGGATYLIPANTNLLSIPDVEEKAIDLNFIVGTIAATKPDISIVIVDASRNNPFAEITQPFGTAKENSIQPNTFFAFSTSPGEVAVDGKERNSPFTKNLIAAVKTPGLTIESVFRKTQSDVFVDSDGRQTPWTFSSLEGEFYFLP